MAKLLVVEDHENLRLSLKACIENDGHEVLVADSICNAKSKLQNNPDLIILDWMLPDGQGLDFLTDLRRKENRTPVIFLTARAEIVDKVLGLELGANDYVTKPFEPRELLVRIRVQLRAQQPCINTNESTLLKVGSLAIDRVKHSVHFEGTRVELVKKEYELLILFAENPEKVFSREEILNKVWGYDIFPTTRTVDTHVMLLRQKTRNELIETVRSVGYKLNPL